MAYTLTAQDCLNQAEDALHQKLLDGSTRVFVDQNGERVEYAVPSIPRLRAYILELKVELGGDLPSPLMPRLL